MKAKQIYEIILESNMEGFSQVKFKSGPFKGYNIKDIVYRLPQTMRKLYNDIYAVHPNGDIMKDALISYLNDAEAKGYTEDDKEFRSLFPSLSRSLISKRGATYGEESRFNPQQAERRAMGDFAYGQVSHDNISRAQMGLDDYVEDSYEEDEDVIDYSKIQDPSQWSKDNKFYKDIMVRIAYTQLIRLNPKYGDRELEYKLDGVTTEGYPVSINVSANSIQYDIAEIADDYSFREYEDAPEGYEIHKVYIKRAVNTSVQNMDGMKVATMRVGSRENIEILNPDWR